MARQSFYDVLCLTSNATLDEIKLAFKRRALQVHPDKGGSKESFHLVYQAFETLADPRARKAYDQGLQEQVCPKPKARPKAGPKAKRSAACKRPAGGTRETPEERQAKILLKLYDLLKRLPRDVRNSVIESSFSQRQRVLLERWIVDLREAEREEAPPQNLQLSGEQQGNLAMEVRSEKRPKKRVKAAHVRGISVARGGYRASVMFDTVGVAATSSNLTTAVEFLVVLTAVKQKMVGRSQDSDDEFQKHLQEAVESSAAEHGRKSEDLRLFFNIRQRCGFFLGRAPQVSSPTVRNVKDVTTFRSWMKPFRTSSKMNGWSRGRAMWQKSPLYLQNQWELFQGVMSKMWEGVATAAAPMKRMYSIYDLHAALRAKHLQQWEGRCMAMEDPSLRRPRRSSPPQAPRKSRTLASVERLLRLWRGVLARSDRLREKARLQALRSRRKAEAKQRRRELEERRWARQQRRREQQRLEALRKAREEKRCRLGHDFFTSRLPGGVQGNWSLSERLEETKHFHAFSTCQKVAKLEARGCVAIASCRGTQGFVSGSSGQEAIAIQCGFARTRQSSD